MSGLPLMPPCRLPTKAQSSACRLQAELEKLRSVGPLDSSEAEEVTQLKVEVGGGGSQERRVPRAGSRHQLPVVIVWGGGGRGSPLEAP